MTIVTLNARGKATVEQAWDRYAELARWPEWSPQISRVESGATRIAPGVTGRVSGLLGLVGVDFEIDSVDENAHTWGWTVRRRPVRLRLHHAVRATDDGAATSLSIDGPAAIVLPYAPIARLALHRLVAA